MIESTVWNVVPCHLEATTVWGIGVAAGMPSFQALL